MKVRIMASVLRAHLVRDFAAMKNSFEKLSFLTEEFLPLCPTKITSIFCQTIHGGYKQNTHPHTISCFP